MRLNKKNGKSVSEIDLLHSQIRKEIRAKKVHNSNESVKYLEAITTIGNMVIQARKQKDSEGLKTMAKAIQDIAFYVNSMEMERETLYLNTRNNYFIV